MLDRHPKEADRQKSKETIFRKGVTEGAAQFGKVARSGHRLPRLLREKKPGTGKRATTT